MPAPIIQLTDELLYFLHIPKTAGMSFNDFIKSHFAPSETNIDTHPLEFIKTPPEKIAQYKFIAGHFFYHIEDFVNRKLVYITMLRDPVERTISHYAHIRRMPAYPSYEFVKSQSLLEFVRDPRTIRLYADFQTRYLASDRYFRKMVEDLGKNLSQGDDLTRQLDSYSVNSAVDTTLLERAQQRISEFAFVGLTERFDDSLELLSATFGWPPPEASKVINFGTNRPAEGEITQQVLDIIRENTKLDTALYEMGKTLFAERYKQIVHRPSDHVEQPIDLTQDSITTMQRKIDLQQKAIQQLNAELQTIQNSFGWRFILRVNATRQKLIPPGSKREAIYLKFRGR